MVFKSVELNLFTIFLISSNRMLIMFFTTYFIDNLALRGIKYIIFAENQIEYEILSVRLSFHLNDKNFDQTTLARSKERKPCSGLVSQQPQLCTLKSSYPYITL